MDSSKNIYNDLVMHFGDVQVAPKQLANLNQKATTPFVDDLDRPGAIAGYQVLLTGYAQHIADKERLTSQRLFLNELIKGLRALPRPIDALIKKGSVSTYQLSNDFYKLHYRIANGQVTIFNIQAQDKLQRQRDKHEKPALYHVKKNSKGTWTIAGKVDAVKTPHAAVNGMLNNLAKATWLMGAHTEHAFGKNITQYTLFHNPSAGAYGDLWESVRDKVGITTEVTKLFSGVLTQTHAAGNNTKWVAHSQGGLIFSEAVRYALNDGSSYSSYKMRLDGIRNPNKGTLLDSHKVAFHGNANNNWRSKKLMERAGITVIAIHVHDYDMVGNIVGLNTISPRKLIGSAVYASHVVKGSITQSTHTTMQSHKSWDQQMQTGPGVGRSRTQLAFEKTVVSINNWLA